MKRIFRLSVLASLSLLLPSSGRDLNAVAAEPMQLPGICCVAISPDGKTVASGRGNGTIQFWDINSGKELKTLTDAVWGLAFSPDGRSLASGSPDGTVKFWDVSKGTAVRTLKHAAKVRTLAFSPDGRTLASVTMGQVITLWDIATGVELRSINAESKMYYLAFSPNGKTLAGGGNDIKHWPNMTLEDGVIYVWEVSTGRLLGNLHNPQSRYINYYNGLAYSMDGRTLAGASHDGHVYLWDLSTGNIGRKLSMDNYKVYSVAYSPDGKILAGSSHFIKLWDAASGSEVRKINDLDVTQGIRSIAFTQDGKTLISGGDDGAVKVWEVSSGKLLRTLAPNSGLIIP